MIRLGSMVLAALVCLPALTFAQQAKINELERKVRDLEAKVRDVERQREDAKRERDEAKREKDRVQQAFESKLKAALPLTLDTIKREKETLALKVNELESKLKAATAQTETAKRDVETVTLKSNELARQYASEKSEKTRLQQDRDEQKEAVSRLLAIVKKELLTRPAVKDDRKLVEQIENADARKICELYQRLK